jgi:hypothetical protein
MLAIKQIGDNEATIFTQIIQKNKSGKLFYKKKSNGGN